MANEIRIVLKNGDNISAPLPEGMTEKEQTKFFKEFNEDHDFLRFFNEAGSVIINRPEIVSVRIWEKPDITLHKNQCGSGFTECGGRFLWKDNKYICDKCGDTCLRLQTNE